MKIKFFKDHDSKIICMFFCNIRILQRNLMPKRSNGVIKLTLDVDIFALKKSNQSKLILIGEEIVIPRQGNE